MRVFLLASALLITAGLYPATYTIAAHNGRDGQPAALLLVTLCLLRGLAMAGAGQGFWVPVLLESSCSGLLLYSIDESVRAPFPVLFGVLAFAVPVAVVTLAWRGRQKWVLAIVGIAVLVRAGGWAGYDTLTAPWRQERLWTPQTSQR
jgi:hypothetical protein